MVGQDLQYRNCRREKRNLLPILFGTTSSSGHIAEGKVSSGGKNVASCAEQDAQTYRRITWVEPAGLVALCQVRETRVGSKNLRYRPFPKYEHAWMPLL